MENQNTLEVPWKREAWGWTAFQSSAESAIADWAAEQARIKLIGILKNAYSGELGAALAYRGHAHSVNEPSEQQMIRQIEEEEIAHRQRVGEMLQQLGAAPNRFHDTLMGMVGKTLGFLCGWSGWLAPMYGAGFLESRNIREYEEAALFAVGAGCLEFLDDLLLMAEVEWEHEKFFREKCQSTSLYQWLPKWNPPPPKYEIRRLFKTLSYPGGSLRAMWGCQKGGAGERLIGLGRKPSDAPFSSESRRPA